MQKFILIAEKILFLSFVLSFFFQTRKNPHTTQLFFIYPFIYLFVLQLTSQKVIYSACRKESSFFIPFLIISFFFQTRKKTKCKFISNYVYSVLTKQTYWFLMLKQFTSVSLYSTALSRDKNLEDYWQAIIRYI